MTKDSMTGDKDFLEKTSERMEKIGLAGYDEIDDNEEEDQEESTSEETTEESDDSTLSDDTDDTDDTDATKDDEAGDDTPTLPDAFRRSAIHQNWTQEEIDDFFKSDPEKALKTFEKIHESNNRLTTEFSKLGKTALALKPVEQSTTDVPESDAITKIINDLKGEHAGDPLYEDVVKPLAQELQIMRNERARKPVQQQTVEEPVARDRDGLVQQINEFYSQDGLRPYDDFYGTPGHPKTNEQLDQYNKVLVLADQIIAGSTLQGTDLSVPDALEKAHLVIADPFRQEATQNSLKKSVQRRGKGVQLKPNASAASVDDTSDNKGTPKSRNELHSRTRDRLKNVFGS